MRLKWLSFYILAKMIPIICVLSHRILCHDRAIWCRMCSYRVVIVRYGVVCAHIMSYSCDFESFALKSCHCHAILCYWFVTSHQDCAILCRWVIYCVIIVRYCIVHARIFVICYQLAHVLCHGCMTVYHVCVILRHNRAICLSFMIRLCGRVSHVIIVEQYRVMIVQYCVIIVPYCVIIVRCCIVIMRY